MIAAVDFRDVVGANDCSRNSERGGKRGIARVAAAPFRFIRRIGETRNPKIHDIPEVGFPVRNHDTHIIHRFARKIVW